MYSQLFSILNFVLKSNNLPKNSNKRWNNENHKSNICLKFHVEPRNLPRSPYLAKMIWSFWFLSTLCKILNRTGVKSWRNKHGATALLEVFDSMTLCHRFSWVRLSYKRKWKSVKFRIIHRCHNQLPHAGVGTSLFYFVKSPVSSHLPSILW